MNKKEKNRESFLIKKGFKKKWLDDKSGYWFVKKFKLGEFKGYFYYDDSKPYCFMEIDCIVDIYKNRILSEVIWSGSWKQFLNKIKVYG